MAARVGSLGALREQNLLAVVDALRVAGGASRAELARATGLSRTTVSTLVADLQERGLVAERAAERGAQPGRPGTIVALEPSVAAGVGIDFDHDRVRVAISDLSRTVLAERLEGFDVDHDATAAARVAARLVDELLDEAEVDRSRVLGAGVALAGPVDQRSGVVRETPILPGWSGRDAAALLAGELGLRVQVDNDANLGALAEVTFGAGTGASVGLYVSVSAGIGAGLIVDGRPYRGWRGIAGEIGHLLVDPDGRICRCGNRGCLETVATVPAVLALLEASRGRRASLDEVVAAARDGDAGARRAIADAGRAIGRALSSVVPILGPEVVVIGGELSTAGDLLVGPLADALAHFTLPIALEGLRVVPGALGDRANVLGALALVVAQPDDTVTARIAKAVA